MLSRRDLLKLGLAGTPCILLPHDALSRSHGLETNFLAGRTHSDSGETPSTLWYHDHFLEFTAPNVYRGLAGFFLVFDRETPTEDKTAYDIAVRQVHRPSRTVCVPLPQPRARGHGDDGSI